MSKGGGGLIQLVAYGAPDVYLTANTGNPYCYNNRDSIMYWFIHRADGFPTKYDLKSVYQSQNLLDHNSPSFDEILSPILYHVPDIAKPNGLTPFSIKKEKDVIKIQRTWRNAISNPRYKLCRKRLLCEFDELLTSC
jgi:hypothetical protein